MRSKSNLKTHGLDFADAERVFSGLTTLYEDRSFSLQGAAFRHSRPTPRRPGLRRPHRIVRYHPDHFFSAGNTP
jgi:hypothetical protein